ncbi:hypothetical protein VTO42DRAFT_8437 [Malbranchea cinnamomea]
MKNGISPQSEYFRPCCVYGENKAQPSRFSLLTFSLLLGSSVSGVHLRLAALGEQPLLDQPQSLSPRSSLLHPHGDILASRHVLGTIAASQSFIAILFSSSRATTANVLASRPVDYPPCPVPP